MEDSPRKDEKDVFQYFQDGEDVYVRDTHSEEEEEDSDNEASNVAKVAMANDTLDQFLTQEEPKPRVQMQNILQAGKDEEDLDEQISKVKEYFKAASYTKCLDFLQTKLVMNSQGQLCEEEVTFYNECLVCVFFKLKEFQNARILAEEMISKMQKQIMFSVNDNETDVPFPLKYMLATINYELKNVKEALVMLYRLLSEVEKIQLDRSSKQTQFDIFSVEPALQASAFEENEGDMFNPLENDDFDGFSRVERIKSNVQEMAQMQRESQADALKRLKKEQQELFGLFPPSDNADGMYMVVCFEIVRIHQRNSDFRNAYIMMSKCIKKYPQNAYVLSKMGRLCLECGRKAEAMEHFNSVFKLMKESSASAMTSKDQGFNPLLNNDQDQNLAILCYLNKGFVNIYDGNYKDAIENFKKILTLKPANIVSLNNSSTCQIFCNETIKAVETMEKIIRLDQKRNINEQTIQNIMSFYEIQFPQPTQKKQALADQCPKNSKETVNAQMYVMPQGKVGGGGNVSTSQSLSQSTYNLNQSQIKK